MFFEKYSACKCSGVRLLPTCNGAATLRPLSTSTLFLQPAIRWSVTGRVSSLNRPRPPLSTPGIISLCLLILNWFLIYCLSRQHLKDVPDLSGCKYSVERDHESSIWKAHIAIWKYRHLQMLKGEPVLSPYYPAGLLQLCPHIIHAEQKTQGRLPQEHSARATA